MEEENKPVRKENELEKQVKGLVGFGAVVKLGRITKEEIDTIAKYCELEGAGYQHVSNTLRKRGRPYSLSDVKFELKCRGCSTLQNYCSC